MSLTRTVPFHLPLVGDEEIEAVAGVIRSGWLTTGAETAAFEQEFRAYTRAERALAVNSATAGLHLALAALGLGPGDEVITTPLTFCATVNTILHTGATPVLADIDETLNVSPEAMRRQITPRTRAILPVHFGGLPCDMPSLWKLASERGLTVVEDAAHAAGATIGGMPVGAGPSDAVAFSFYATKNLTTGEGGMVTTRSAELEQKMRVLCLHGMSRDAWDRYTNRGTYEYQVVECGFKYNLTDLAAAIGRVQLRRLDAMTGRRREIAQAYSAAFADLDEVELPPEAPGHCWHLYALRLNLDRLAIDRREFFDQMKARGVCCSVHFIPIPLHPLYQRCLEARDPCARALAEYPRLISLPLYARMSEDDVEAVIAAVRTAVRRNAKQHVFAAGHVA